jgi:hypothetical protein
VNTVYLTGIHREQRLERLEIVAVDDEVSVRPERYPCAGRDFFASTINSRKGTPRLRA